MEHFAEMHTPQAASAAKDRVNALVVGSLVRAGSPEPRSAFAERRLLRTVAEWAPGTGIDVMLRSAVRGGRVHAEIRPLGEVQTAWQRDVAGAFEGIANLERRRLPPMRDDAPRQLAELERDPARSRRRAEEDFRARDAQPLGAADVVWPTPSRDASLDLIAVLRSAPGSFVRVLIASPSDFERRMLLEEMSATWDRITHLDLDAYLGSPVLCRTFVGTKGENTGIAALRAAVRGWGAGQVLRDLETEERARAQMISVGDLAGHIRPEGWALSALRLPAAGPQPTRGIASKLRPVAERPMSYVPPRTATSIVLGTGLTELGRRVPVTVEAADLCRHVFVEGRSGSGKTTFVTALIAELSRKGIGCTLLEHHGTGIDQALRALDPRATDRAIVVRHGDASAPAGINLFDESDPDVREQMTAEFIELVQAIFDPRNEGIVGPRWRRWFSLLCDGVAAHFGPDATLLHLLAVASDPALVKKLALRLAKTDRDLGLRLHNEVGSLSGDEASNLPAWAISKFQPLVGQRRMREILGRPRDAVDVTRLLDEGGTLLVDLAGSALGTGSARMLGSLWLLKHWVAMGRRADRSRPHVLIVDEAHLMTFGALPAMLAEARKFGVGVVIVSQSIESLSPALQSAIEANVGTFLSYRLGLNTAARASARLEGWPAQELVRLPDLRAASTLTRGGLQTEPFLLTTTRPPIDDADAHAQAAAIDARCSAIWRSLVGPTVTDAHVAAALAPPQPSRPREQTSGKSPSDRSSFLEDWLTARATDPVDTSRS